MAATRLVAVNDSGRRIGEDHPRAKIADHDVELLVQLRAEGYSYQWLAEKFEISKTLAYLCCTGALRGQWPAKFKAVVIMNPRARQMRFDQARVVVDPRDEGNDR